MKGYTSDTVAIVPSPFTSGLFVAPERSVEHLRREFSSDDQAQRKVERRRDTQVSSLPEVASEEMSS